MNGLTNGQQSIIMLASTLLIAIGSINIGTSLQANGQVSIFGAIILIAGAMGTALKELGGTKQPDNTNVPMISQLTNNLDAQRDLILAKTEQINAHTENVKAISQGNPDVKLFSSEELDAIRTAQNAEEIARTIPTTDTRFAKAYQLWASYNGFRPMTSTS